MSISYDANGVPQPYYPFQDQNGQLPPTPLSGLIDTTVDPTAVYDPLDPNNPANQSATGPTATSPLSTPVGGLPMATTLPQLFAPPAAAPSASLTGNEIVNQMFSPQSVKAAAGVAPPGMAAPAAMTGSEMVNQMFSPGGLTGNPAGSSATMTPQQPQVDPNSWAGKFMNWEKQNLPESVSTGVNSALESVGPGAAGMIGMGAGRAGGTFLGAALGDAVAGAGVGAIAGLGVGDEVTIPLGAIAGFVGGILGMFGTQALATNLQGQALKQVMGPQQYDQYINMRAQQDAQNPVASLVGQFTGMGMFLRPNLRQLLQASKVAGMFAKTGDVGIFANPANAEAVKALHDVVGGAGSQFGVTAFNQWQQGRFDLTSLAASTLMGALTNHNTALGDKLISFGDRIMPPQMRLEVNHNVEAAKAAAEDGSITAAARPPVTEKEAAAHEKLLEDYRTASTNLNTLRAQKASKDTIGQAVQAKKVAAIALTKSQFEIQRGVNDAATNMGAAGLSNLLATPAQQQESVNPAAGRITRPATDLPPTTEQVPHAVENGTTVLQPGEFFHAVPSVSSAVNDNVLGTTGPDPLDYNLPITQDPQTAIDNLGKVVGPDPGLVVVRLQNGHDSIGDGTQVTARSTDVESVRPYRNVSGRTPSDQASQFVEAARTSTAHEAVFAPKEEPGGLHVQAVEPDPKNLAMLSYEITQLAAHDAANLDALNYMNAAVRDVAARGADLVIARDINGTLSAAASYTRVPKDETLGMGDSLEVHSIGSIKSGAGTRLMTEVARTAAANKMGLVVQSHPNARDFYKALGMKELDKNFFGLTPTEAAKMANSVDEVTSPDGTIRALPKTVTLDLRSFDKPLIDKMIARAVQMGATERPAAKVVTGWIFPDGRGLELGGVVKDKIFPGGERKLIHDDVLAHPDVNSAVGGKPAFMEFLKEGGIRVATTSMDITFHTDGTLPNSTIRRIEDNLISRSGEKMKEVMLVETAPYMTDIEAASNDHYFTTEDFKNNNFNLLKTIREADAVNARLANNRLDESRSGTLNLRAMLVDRQANAKSLSGEGITDSTRIPNGETQHGISEEATNQANQVGNSKRPYQASEVFKALEARAFGYSRQEEGAPKSGGPGNESSANGNPAEAANAAAGTTSAPADGGSGTDATTGLSQPNGGSGTDLGSTLNGGDATTTGNADTGGSTDATTGNGISDAQPRDAGSATLDGTSDGTSGARAGGLRAPSLERNDEAGSANAEATANPTGNSAANDRGTSYAQLRAEAGTTGGTALDHPVTFTGKVTELGSDGPELLARLAASGLNDNGLVHEIHVNPSLSRADEALGIYRSGWRHSVEVDPAEVQKQMATIDVENLLLQARTEYDMLPDAFKPQFAAARTKLEQAIGANKEATSADRLFSVVGHEFIHPQIIEARQRMYAQELEAQGIRHETVGQRFADRMYQQVRYMPSELLDNLGRNGLGEQVHTLRWFYNVIGGNGPLMPPEKVLQNIIDEHFTKAEMQEVIDASGDIEEHLNALIMGARGIGIDDYSQATPEAYAYSVWNPEGLREGQQLADNWLRANASPASEAPYLRSASPSEPDRAAALAAARAYYATRSAADWGGDRPAANQAGLTYAKKLPGELEPEFVERKALTEKTSEAAKLPRLPHDTDATYADRVAAKANYASADHVNRIIAAAHGDLLPLEVRKGQTYFKIDTEEYKGTPKQLVRGMSANFRKIMGGAKDREVQQALANEPPVDNGNPVVHPDQIYHDLVQPRVDGKVEPVQPPTQLPLFSDAQYASLHQQAHAGMETGLQGADMVAEGDGPFDVAGVTETAATNAGIETPPAEPATNEAVPPVDSGSGFAANQSQLYQYLNQIPGISYNKSQKAMLATAQKWLNFTQAFNDARKQPELAPLANDFHKILTAAAGLHEFDALSARPEVWVDRTVNAIHGMNVRINEAGKKLGVIIGGDKELNDRLTKAIDTGKTDGLVGKNEVAIANLIHNYWQMTGDFAQRLDMIDSATEAYLPHLVLSEEGQAVRRGVNFKRSTVNAIRRVADKKGNVIFDNLDALEEHLGPGSVERDLAKIFTAHGEGWNSALLYNNLIRKGQIDLRLPGSDHNVVINTREYKKLADHTAYKSVTAGPMRRGLAGLYVEKSMAARIDRLTPYSEMEGTAQNVAKNINRLNGWFKEVKFVGPMHMWSLMSNIASMHGGNWLTGAVPPMADPTTYKVIGRGADIAGHSETFINHLLGRKSTNPEGNMTRLAEALEAGIPLMHPAEDMDNAIGVLNRLPGVAGKFFTWWHDLMWRRVGFHGMLGTWDYLSQKYADEYARNHDGVMPTGSDKKALDAYAANDARRALGFLTDLDMTKDYRLYSNSLLLAAKWSTAQLRVMGDAFNIKFFSELGGGERLPMGSELAQKIGSTQAHSMARRLLLGGMARLMMTSLVFSTLGSALITGSPSTPVQNFMRDPMHTFDIYAGRDPQTNQDRWIHMPVYMFQREFMDWTMAAVRAYSEGQGPINTALAPGERYFSKANPILRTTLEAVMGREIGKWMQGYGDNSDIDHDKSIQNIHKALDNMGYGMPGWAAPVENRLIYAIRNVSPLQAAFPTNPTAPPTNTGDLLSALGPGSYNLLNPSNASSLLGARIDKGIQYERNPNTGQDIPVSQAVAQSQARTSQIDQMVQAAIAGDYNTAETMRQQLGLTPGQFKEYVTFGASHTTQAGIYAQTPQQGVALTSKGPSLTTLFGAPLNPAQQTQYFNMQAQREEQVLSQISKLPGWNKMSSSEHQNIGSQWLAFADKISAEQYGQAIGARPGAALTNVQANKMISDAFQLEDALSTQVKNDPAYQSAAPQVQQQMLAERQSAAKTAVWDANLGGLKGLSLTQLQNMVTGQTGVRDNVTSYVQTLPGYANAPDIYTQQQYLTRAMTWADQMVADSYAGKKADSTLAAPLTPAQVWPVVKNGLALQDSAFNMLHQSSVYTEALPADQQKLDDTYASLAHRIVLLDQRDNVDLTQQGALYQSGFGQAIQSRLMADEGYQQLENSFGGSQEIAKHTTELNALKTQFAQERGVPQASLAKYNALIEAWYEQNNPQYGLFLRARAQWETRNPIGQLYTAFKRDELAYAATEDPLAQQLADQQSTDTLAASLSGY